MVYAVVFGLHVEAATPTVLRAYPMEPNPVFQAVVTVWYYHPGRTPAVLRAYISNTPFEIVQTLSGAELSLGPCQFLTHRGGVMTCSDIHGGGNQINPKCIWFAFSYRGSDVVPHKIIFHQCSDKVWRATHPWESCGFVSAEARSIYRRRLSVRRIWPIGTWMAATSSTSGGNGYIASTPGQEFMVLHEGTTGDEAGWVYVSATDGTRGWISQDCLQIGSWELVTEVPPLLVLEIP